MKIIFALLLTTSILCGAALDFRSGKVLCAEISTQAPARLKKLVNPVFPDLPAAPVYAALTVFFDEGRNISLHDYAIQIFGKNYHCIAIENKGRFLCIADRPSHSSQNWKTVELVDPKTPYTLFFTLDSGELGSSQGKQETLILKPLFHNVEGSGDKIVFQNLGDKPFTPRSKIPKTGMMVIKK